MIRVEKATKYYGSHCAVRDLDFHIPRGQCVGFLGLNGAGKSTTLRLLSCLLLPTSGKVTIRGLDVEDNPHEIRKFIGYLPETPPLYSEMTVREFLGFAGRLRGMSGAAIDARLPAVIETCGVSRVIDAPIHTLSHGYKQRVGIGQAIIHEPELLILDEPTLGLDPVQIVEMREMIRALRGKHTILLSTHMLAEIEATCDRILMMSDGRIAAEGTEAELAQRYGGGGTLEIEVRAEEGALRAALSTLVTSLEITGTHAGLLHARVQTSEERRAEISAALVHAGLGLLEIRRVTSGLESVFLRMGNDAAAGRAGLSAAPAVEEGSAS